MLSASYLIRDSKTAVTDTRPHLESSFNINPNTNPELMHDDEILATAEKKHNYMGNTQPPDAFKHAAKQSFMTS